MYRNYYSSIYFHKIRGDTGGFDGKKTNFTPSVPFILIDSVSFK